MIPQSILSIGNGIEKITYPTQTYRLHFSKNRVSHYTDGLEAIEQMIFKVLQTHRYRYEIYDWTYGFEVDDLFGKDKGYVRPELERRITECLLVDDRIIAVDPFSFPEPANHVYSDKRTTICVRFTVHTRYGILQMEKEFNS